MNKNISTNIQQPSTSLSSTSVEVISKSLQPSTTKLQHSLKMKKPNKNSRKLFLLLIAVCIEDSDDSIEAISSSAMVIMPNEFSSTSIKKLLKFFSCITECLYKRFDKLNMFKNMFCLIYNETRLTVPAVMMAAFKQHCTREMEINLKNSKWSEIVMFGKLLCELTITYHGETTFFVNYLNFWIEKIILIALRDSDDARIAFKMILNHLMKNETIFKEIDKNYMKILSTLSGCSDNKRKIQMVESCLNKKLESSWIIDFGLCELEDLVEIKKSRKCKDFNDYIKKETKGLKDCCEFFVDASDIEIEYIATKFVEFATKNPKEIKILGLIASGYQTIMIRIRKFIRDVVKSLETEFNLMKESENLNSLKCLNLAKILGELFVSNRRIITNQFMTEFLKFLKDKGELMTLTSTLKLCGYVYKNKESEKFKNLMESFVFCEIVEEEIRKESAKFAKVNQLYESRLFKPNESSKKISNLETALNSILKNKDVEFTFEKKEMMYINTNGIIQMLIDSLLKPDANFIEVAKFLKFFYNFTFKIDLFFEILDSNIQLKVSKMTLHNNLQYMKSLGKLIAELNNLLINQEQNQELWLEEFKTFEFDDIFEVIDAYVDVVKSMLVNIQIYDSEQLEAIHEYLQKISNSLQSDTGEQAIRIKSKVDKILQNITLKEVYSEILNYNFNIRIGKKIERLPEHMPEISEDIIDVQDFAKIFYINAVSNQHFTSYFIKSIAILKSDPKGLKFIQSLRDTLIANVSLNSSDFLESEETPGTLALIFYLFKEDVLSELRVLILLQKILKFNSFENHKEILMKFMEDVMWIVAKRDRRNVSRHFEEIKNCVERIRQKIQIEKVENMKIKAIEVNTEACLYEIDNNSYINSKIDDEESELSESFCELNQDDLNSAKWITAVLINDHVCHNLNDLTSTDLYASKSQELLPANHNNLPSTSKGGLEIGENENTINSSKKLEDSVTNDQKTTSIRLLRPSFLEMNFMLKPGDIYQFQSTSLNQSSNPASKASLEQQSLDEIILKTISTAKIIKFVENSEEVNQNLMELYKKILSMITKNSSLLKLCATLLYNWKIKDSNLKPQVTEIIKFLSTEIQKNHKLLLTSVFQELRKECDVILNLAEPKKPKRKARRLQRINTFIVMSKAYIPFLENHDIYDFLDNILHFISDGHKIALDLFFGITDGIEDIFEIENKQRDICVTTWISILECALNNENNDCEVKQNISKKLEFFKTLNIITEVSSPLPDRKKRKGNLKNIHDSQEINDSNLSSIQNSSHEINNQPGVADSISSSDVPSNKKINNNNYLTREQLSQYFRLSEESRQKYENSTTNVIKDPPPGSSIDDQIIFYVDQLQSSNIRLLSLKILSKGFSNEKLMDILLQKVIADPEHVKLLNEFLKHYSNKKSKKKCIEYVLIQMFNEVINLCKDGGKEEQKMINLTALIIEFYPYIHISNWSNFWKQLIIFVDKDCPNSLKVFLTLMSVQLDIFCSRGKQKELKQKILMVLKRKLSKVENDEESTEKIKKIIFVIEERLESMRLSELVKKERRRKQKILKISVAYQAKIDNVRAQKQENNQGLSKNDNLPNKFTDNIHQPASSGILSTIQNIPTYIEIQSSSNEKFIQIHPDDATRHINFPPNYFLFDDNITNPQKFTNILNTLCQDCKNFEQNSIKIKESIAIAILKINILRIQPKPEEVSQCAEIFYELYTRLDQTKFIQWVLIRFLKAWRLYDQTHFEDLKKPDEQKIKLYDRYSKSVLRVIRSFDISRDFANKASEKIKDEAINQCDVVRNNDNSTNSVEGCKDQIAISDVKISNNNERTDDSNISTTKARTLVLNFDDFVPKNSSSTESTSRIDDLNLKCDKNSENLNHPTSKSLSIRTFNNFMSKLQILLFNRLVDPSIDINRDPFFDYFIFKKRIAYEIACDLYFNDIISTNFIFDCIKRMFEYPIIIDKNIDVVVRLMILMETMISMKYKQKDFKYLFQVLKSYWIKLPFGIQSMFPITVDKWTVMKIFIQHTLQFRLKPSAFRELIHRLWIDLIENPEKFKDIVQIFEDFLEVLGDNFTTLMVDFMNNCRNNIEVYPIEKLSKTFSSKYKSSILFAFELFEMGILNCENFSKWFNDNIYQKLIPEDKDEISIKLGQKGLKVDKNIEENLNNYYKMLYNID